MAVGSQVRPATSGAAWTLYLALRDEPSPARVMALAQWLRQHPSHTVSFDAALTLWALSGAALQGRAPLAAHRGGTGRLLFDALHHCPCHENAERLVGWLADDPARVRQLDAALTGWGLAQSGPVGERCRVRVPPG
ncbi:hypothetical protein [Rhizobacter sp. Root1221]|uniref:hypothetical protein n=1 Tax=Rhizobacter sp. Root1221 TaxID=1736433 RepID=UPI000A5F67CC|nr:hypothetical protein [Rhizobacter sp. Root1221]